MQMTPYPDWLSVWAEAIRTLGPAVVASAATLLGSYLLFRNQLKTKVTEIKGQSELRARELLFDAYQKKIDRISKNANEAGTALGQLGALLRSEEDESAVEEALKSLPYLMKVLKSGFWEAVEDLENELKALEVPAKSADRIVSIKKGISVDIQSVTSFAEVQEIFMQWVNAVNAFYVLIEESLTRKAESLFSEFLPVAGSKSLKAPPK